MKKLLLIMIALALIAIIVGMIGCGGSNSLQPTQEPGTISTPTPMFTQAQQTPQSPSGGILNAKDALKWIPQGSQTASMEMLYYDLTSLRNDPNFQEVNSKIADHFYSQLSWLNQREEQVQAFIDTNANVEIWAGRGFDFVSARTALQAAGYQKTTYSDAELWRGGKSGQGVEGKETVVLAKGAIIIGDYNYTTWIIDTSEGVVSSLYQNEDLRTAFNMLPTGAIMDAMVHYGWDLHCEKVSGSILIPQVSSWVKAGGYDMTQHLILEFPSEAEALSATACHAFSTYTCSINGRFVSGTRSVKTWDCCVW